MNRAQRRASRHKRQQQPHSIDYTAGLRLLDHARPYEPDEMLPEHNLTRAAFERLRTGHGTEADFDRVSMQLNFCQIRASEIDELLLHTIQLGQKAMARMKARYLRGLPFGLDADGLSAVPDAIDALIPIVDGSSPLQMRMALAAVVEKMRAGDILSGEDA